MAAGDFQDRMMKYIKYGLSIKTTVAEGKGYNLVGINYKPKWDVIKPSEESGVFCIPATENNGLCYYFSEVSKGVGCIFDSIEETIRYNEDIERKVSLLKDKIIELRELFANERYEDLIELKFVMEKEQKQKKNKPKKQSPKKNEPETKEDGQKQTESSEHTEDVQQEDCTEIETKKNNSEEANEIDAKIAKALGMKK